jgi:predicted amidohydrolase
MKVAALQMVSTPRVAENLAQARALIAQAAQAGAELVALPEYFCLMGLHDKDKLSIAEPLADALRPDPATTPMQAMLAQSAREHGVWLVGGTLPILSHEAERVLNTVLVFSPQGERIARYDKIHLFCFDDGQRRYDEAASLTPGTQPVSFEMRDKQGEPWHIGLSVCYDLRFPELFRMLGAAKPLDLIVLPAAFTDTTGKAHWELLLRARAVENLCHVLAPAQGGLHENGRRTFGHALAIEPWGHVLSMQTQEGPGVVMAELSKAHQTAVRTQLPALSHRVLG